MNFTSCEDLIKDKISFIHSFISADTPASGSKFDANANVSNMNLATLTSELWKREMIQLNRAVTSVYLDYTSREEYQEDLDKHRIYSHDETSIFPYCVSLSLYPMLLDGLKKLGGESGAPKHLDSFCGSFVNLVFAVSAQFAGAVATPEFLMYFDYFARKDYGDDYLFYREEEVFAKLQQVVYSLNQPAAARGYQACFWNVALFDRYFMEGMFGNFIFPDGSSPDFDSFTVLQGAFLKWFRNERTKAVLTFPVVTAALLNHNEDVKDPVFCAMLAEEMSKGSSFFVYQSDQVDSLSSCCRLRNAFVGNDFSFSLGAGGVATGSTKVVTINLNRLIQDYGQQWEEGLREQVQRVHKYLIAHRHYLEDMYAKGMMPVYDAGFISLDKQFLTVGVSGLVEAAEYLGFTPSVQDEDYIPFACNLLKIISEENKTTAKLTGYKINTEFVPGESLGVKFAAWDRKDGYDVPRDCYNSYLYRVEDCTLDVVEKFTLHGKEVIQYLDGGSALHLNLDAHYTERGFRNLFRYATKTGCNYWTYNVPSTCCEACGKIDPRQLSVCSSCGSNNITYATRIIGYLKKVKHFSKERQAEHATRHYHHTV